METDTSTSCAENLWIARGPAATHVHPYPDTHIVALARGIEYVVTWAAVPDAGSLSSCLCKLISVRSGQVGGEAVGVGERERAEGGFPALDDRAFD
jgi:hypothetical protein